MGIIKLRDYQEACKNAFFKELRQGRKRFLVVLPTGAGKTLVFSSIIAEMNKRTLIIAHRDELIQQAHDKLKMVWPDSDIGIFKGTHKNTDHQIIVASIQTLANEKNLKQLPPIEFVVYDECHHSQGPTNLATLGKIMRPETILLGVTATPNRADGLGLGAIFADHPGQGVVYQRSVLEMISDGYLSPIRGIQGNLQVELDKVAKNRGDYELSSLSKVMNTPEVNLAVLQLWESFAKNKKTLIFAVDVAHTQALSDFYNAHGYKASYIHGGLNLKKRHEILEDFAEGRIQVLINCAVLTEGFDEPSIECVYLVRPTTSTSLYVQSVGRGLRLYPGKTECLIIDAVKNSKKHNLVTITDLFPKVQKKQERNGENPLNQKREDNQEPEEIVIGRAWFEAQESQIYRSEYNWQQSLEGGFKLNLIGGYIHLRKTPNGWSPYFVSKNGEEIILYQHPLNVDYAMGIAESKIKELNLDRFAQKDAKWRKDKATEGQLNALKKWGIVPDHPLSKGEASEMLERLIDEKELREKKNKERLLEGKR